MLERSAWGRALIILGVVAVGMWVVQQFWLLAVHFGDIIILFFLAWLLAFCLAPVVRSLQFSTPLGRAGSAGIVYLVLLVLLITVVVLIVPILVFQVSGFATQLPALTTKLPGMIRGVQTALSSRGVPVDLSAPSSTTLSQEAGQLGAQLVANTVSIASGVASGVFSFVIIMILSFYLVVDGDRFVVEFLDAVPLHYRADTELFFESVQRSFGGFLRGTAIQAAILAIGTAIIMLVAGVHYVLLASVFAGVVMVIPFIGPLLALVLPLLIGLFSGMSTSQLVVYILALVALQMLVMNVIAPKVMSESVGLHPLWVFAALLIGAKEAGIAGAIFGVPVAAVVYASARILLRRWRVIESAPSEVTIIAAELSGGTYPKQQVRVERLGASVSSAVYRLFHGRRA